MASDQDRGRLTGRQRFGVNALDVIENVEKRFKEIATSLPKSVEIVPVYDRSNLIYAAIDTLRHTLVRPHLSRPISSGPEMLRMMNRPPAGPAR